MSGEVANTVGKLQYRLLLCQWEKGNVQRQLQTATRQPCLSWMSMGCGSTTRLKIVLHPSS